MRLSVATIATGLIFLVSLASAGLSLAERREMIESRWDKLFRFTFDARVQLAESYQFAGCVVTSALEEYVRVLEEESEAASDEYHLFSIYAFCLEDTYKKLSRSAGKLKATTPTMPLSGIGLVHRFGEGWKACTDGADAALESYHKSKGYPCFEDDDPNSESLCTEDMFSMPPFITHNAGCPKYPWSDELNN